MVLHSGKWVADDCSKHKPYVCLVNALPQTTLPSITTPKPLGCMETWTYFNHTGFCYKVIPTRTNWNEAETTCIKEKAHLISIHSWEENSFVTELASSYSTNICHWTEQTWTGMHMEINTTVWKWTDGTPFDYVNWEYGEPSSPGVENCVDVWTGMPCNNPPFFYAPAEFNDEMCDTTTLNFMCKKSIE